VFAAEGRHILGYDPARTPTTDTLGRWLKQLHDFGPIRATGTPQCRALPTPICSAGSEKPVS
jgi:hypothetical protein